MYVVAAEVIYETDVWDCLYPVCYEYCVCGGLCGTDVVVVVVLCLYVVWHVDA
jgi:hypothetical protein